MVQLHPGSLDERCVGAYGGTPPRYGGRPGSNPGLTSLTKQYGLLVQRDDTWPATRKSGFDSPAVH